MLRTLALPLLLATLLPAPAAQASDWRYCLARIPAAHQLVLSRAGQTASSIDDVERAFSHVLERAGITHDAVLCPRGADQASIDAAIAQAIAYNRLEHFTPVTIDWSP